MPSFFHGSRKSSARQARVRRLLLHVLMYIAGLIAVAAAALLLVRGVGNVVVVIDQSMAPLLQSEDRVLTSRASSRNIHNMDVIAMHIGTSDSSPVYIRRVIGVPGDTVRISGGQIYVNDQQLDISFNDKKLEDAGTAQEGVKLEEDHYFVLCDNYNENRDDSRLDSIGTVSSQQIIGKVWMICSPFKRMKFIH